MNALPGPAGLRAEIQAVRREAVARVTEMDLLVAALRDHIRDLQAERDALRAELARLRRERLLAAAAWLPRGLRPQCGAWTPAPGSPLSPIPLGRPGPRVDELAAFQLP
jgi:hypothetical protein